MLLFSAFCRDYDLAITCICSDQKDAVKMYTFHLKNVQGT